MPCLDVEDGGVVKGIRSIELKVRQVPGGGRAGLLPRGRK